GARNSEHTEQCNHEPRGEFVDSENCKGKGRQPIEQGRLLDVDDVVEVRDQNRPARDHLARNFRITSLIRLPQAVTPKIKEENERWEGWRCGSGEHSIRRRYGRPRLAGIRIGCTHGERVYRLKADGHSTAPTLAGAIAASRSRCESSYSLMLTELDIC